MNGTIVLPKVSTNNRPRNRCLPQNQEQHRHMYQVLQLPPVVPQIRWVVVEKFQYLHLPLPLLE
jgi:hypothetical protein